MELQRGQLRGEDVNCPPKTQEYFFLISSATKFVKLFGGQTECENTSIFYELL